MLGFSPFGGLSLGGFGGFGAFDVFGGSQGFGGQGFTSSTFSSSASFSDFSNRPGVKKTSTSTRFVNGQKIETRKVIENGIETVTIHEDGQLKSKTVNGVPQSIAY
jgi:DnaJ family protein B protein 6